MEWINIEKEKPEEGQEILIIYNDFVMEGKYENKNFYYQTMCSCMTEFRQCEEQEIVTYWMPLPKPPENKDEMD